MQQRRSRVFTTGFAAFYGTDGERHWSDVTCGVQDSGKSTAAEEGTNAPRTAFVLCLERRQRISLYFYFIFLKKYVVITAKFTFMLEIRGKTLHHPFSFKTQFGQTQKRQ